MNYKLAKKLKKAGFPEMDIYFNSFINEYELPPLEELIKECGDEFDSLENPVKDDWFAEAKTNEEKDICKSCGTRTVEPIIQHGKTPLEAVAKLYIKLNEK